MTSVSSQDGNTVERLSAKLAETEEKLAEAREVISAIRSGDVDAVVVSGPSGEQVFTLRGAEYSYRVLVEAMSEGAATLNSDGTILYCNQHFADLMAVPLERVLGQPFLTLVRGDSADALKALFSRALKEGTAKAEIGWVAISEKLIPAQVSLSRIKGGEPISLCMVVTDLTESKKWEEMVSAGKLATSILESSAEAIAVCDETGKIVSANEALKRLRGANPILEDFDATFPLEVEDDGEPPARFTIHSAMNGEIRAQEACFRREDGSVFSLLLSSGRIIGDSGIAGCVLTLTDITGRKQTIESLRESEEELRILDHVGATLASELDLKKLVQVVTDAGRELSQAEFGAFFYNDTDATGEKYLLYTLSGVPEEAFRHFPMPRNTEVFGPTFSGQGTVRAANIRKDPRYGKNPPHHGVPKGHLPVLSYLAVPVISRSGEVIGGLFYGHSREGVFTERAERLVEGIAKQAAIAMDNASLFDAMRNQQARVVESEARFRALVSASSYVVFRMSPDWSKMWQLEGQNFMSDTQSPTENWIDLYIDPQDQATVRDTIQQAVEKKVMFELEHRVRRVDGTLGWTLSRAVPVLDDKGDIVEWFGAATDVTIRKAAEQALRESEQRFRVITEATPIMVWMAGTDKLCYYFNRSWLDFVGRTLEDESGNGWTQNVHPDDLDGCLQLFIESFDARRSFEMEYRIRRHDGEYRWITNHGVPRYAPDGTFEGYVGGCLDVHDQREAAEKLRRASESLRESEERLRLAQQVGTIGSFEWNVQTNVNQWSPEMEAIYGLQPGQFAGTQEAWVEMLHPDDKAAIVRHVEMSLVSAAPMQAEWRAIWPDKSVHWILGRWQAFKDDSGRTIRLNGVNIDITRRKESEQIKRRLAAVVECSVDAIISMELDGTVISWNPAAERLYGYAEHEMVGRSITAIVPEELQADEQKILETIGSGKRIEHFKTVRLTKSGERLDVSLTISPVRDDAGKVIGAAKIARDITQEKKTEQALRTTERLASVGRMAATVAHEINNPLEAVMNLVFLAKGSAVREDVRKYIDTIEEELTRISHITKQTLGFYRESTAPSALRIGTMLDPIVAIFSSRARNRGIEICSEVRHDPEIYAVAGEIRQVIANLLSNSIDAVNSGGIIRIRVGSARLNGGSSPGVRITVADSGPGIPRSFRSKLFEPFFTTKKDVGTGLGLWVCKTIVERHHGSIRLKSSPNSEQTWTVFTVFLPSSYPPSSET